MGPHITIMHPNLAERIRELEAELAALKKTEYITDLSAVRKAFNRAYGKKKFIKEGWDDNVIDGCLERTYNSDVRYDIYIVLVIKTKNLRIKLDYYCRYEEDENYTVYLVNDDGSQTEITEPCGNEFERRLIKMMMREPPTYIEQFDE